LTCVAPASQSGAGPGVQARRVIFIDLARAIAVILMINGHTISALLAPDYQSGPWYDRWQFQRGLTSNLFLLLSGFAFSIATSRHWPAHLWLSFAVFRRLRRFGLLMVLGYALHFPVSHFSELAAASEERWRSFLAVDVLQLIGATLVLVQVLVMACRSRIVFAVVSLAMAVTLIGLTPTMWRIPWAPDVPLFVAGYLSQGTGSIFPIFPFGASIFIGVGIGQIYSRWGAAHLASFENRVLLSGGALLVALGMVPHLAGGTLFPPGPGSSIPGEFVLRTGVSFVILGGIAHASRWMSHLPHIIGALAQESLVIYFVHLCFVYGSIWNPGLYQWIGPNLSPVETLPIVLGVLVAMILVAWYWNWCKHARPRAARWIMVGTGAVLVGLLV